MIIKFTQRDYLMKSSITLLSLSILLIACGSKTLPTVPEGLADNAKPLYEECIADYKKTMSDKDAQKACTEKLKGIYESTKD